MEIAFVAIIAVAVAAPLIAAANAMQRRVCPHCGEAVEADPRLVRMFVGE